MNKCVYYNYWLYSNMIYISTELPKTKEYSIKEKCSLFFFMSTDTKMCSTTFTRIGKQKTNRICSVVLLKSRSLLKRNIICLLPPLNTLWGHVNILRNQNSCALCTVHSDCNKFVRDAHVTQIMFSSVSGKIFIVRQLILFNSDRNTG